MKGIIHKIFRYHLVSVYFIISQMVILMSVFNVLHIFNKAYAKERERLEAIADNRIELTVDTVNGQDMLTGAGKGVTKGNVVAEGKLTCEVAEIGSLNRCEVILSINEATPYKMISGHIPGESPDDTGKRCVALGRNKVGYAKERDGIKYLTINQEEYEVVGIIGSENSDFWDYKIVLNSDCMGDKLKNSYKSVNNYTITIYSNLSSVQETFEQVYQNLLSADSYSNIVAVDKRQKGESTVKATLQRENLRTNVLVYVFCIINSIIISMFWVVQRKKEVAIKRVFGYSNIRIVSDLARDLLLLMIITFVFYLTGYAIVQFIIYLNTGMYDHWNLTSVLAVIGMFFLTMIITLVTPVIEIYKNASEIIK